MAVAVAKLSQEVYPAVLLILECSFYSEEQLASIASWPWILHVTLESAKFSDKDGIVSVELVKGFTGVLSTKWQDENFSFPGNDFTADALGLDRSVEVAHSQA